ncbi:MAG: DMT family transporter [Rhodospirillaceae bacterium]|nr:DMT family transporter [Rhodospirillaceae bacterium]MCY4237104.1 DMT family transporter [Rhodospirillaceae bacterium]
MAAVGRDALPPGQAPSALSDLFIPLAFVLLWSTGFIFTKLGMPYTEPLTFLSVRFAIVLILFLGLTLMMRATWPSRAERGHSLIVGLLLQGGYLGGVFIAIAQGVPTGVAALIVCLQPVLTATLVGRVLGERVRPIQWVGLVLGLTGAAMVLWRKLGLEGGPPEGSLTGYGFAIAGLLGITAGTIYQKRFCTAVHPASAGVFQYLAALILVAIGAQLTEDWRVDFLAGEFLIAIVWLTVVLSIITFWLLMIMIRRGAANRVASWFYLVPPLTALFAYFLFGETLGPLALAGMVIAMAGVALVNRA